MIGTATHYNPHGSEWNRIDTMVKFRAEGKFDKLLLPHHIPQTPLSRTQRECLFQQRFNVGSLAIATPYAIADGKNL